ncbi:Chloroperoxidase [Mycena vulgaris]|nr:Chloroperoxidase [Mycena vulgaris]
MSIPTAHPAVESDSDKTCPITGKSHEYRPPAPGDIRSVCPAINAMANHGYIRRDGKKISMYAMFSGLKACYGLSTPLAGLLTVGGWILIKRIGKINLFDLGLHNAIEHDASVIHVDCPPGQKDAPIEIQPGLMDEFATQVVATASAAAGHALAEEEVVVMLDDVVRTRIRRERLSKPLDKLHAEIGHGEMAMILGVWNRTINGREGAPLAWMRALLGEERLPEGWHPDHVETLRNVRTRASTIRGEMKRIREEEAAAADDHGTQ